jgi:cytochrome c oxidase assembly protein subunit 15
MSNTASTESSPSPAWLRRFALLLCFATLCLIFLGGQVKSHEAGLSVPDWPLTYGENPVTFGISKWRGGIFHEHFHRLFAGGVALATVALAICLYLKENRVWLVVLGAGAVMAVLLQALLGGMTVWYQLPVLVSSSHAILAQTFFLITLVIWYGLSRERTRRMDAIAAGARESVTPLKYGALILIALVYGQLFLGAVMRHTESGLAVYDFPTTAGSLLPWVDEAALADINHWRFENTDSLGAELPDVTLNQVLIHLAHRGGALIVTTAIVVLAVLAFKRRATHPDLWRTALWLCGAVALQITLGAFTIWTIKHPYVTSVHVVTGAGILGLSGLLALRAWPLEVQPLAAESEAARPVLNTALS